MLRKPMWRVATLIIAIAGLLQGCSEPDQPAQQPTPPEQSIQADTDSNPLLNPQSAAMNLTAPAMYQVLFDTSKGAFTIEVTREWAPKGADRFYSLAKNGFFDGIRFFRVIRSPRPFMAQFGISGDPAVATKWDPAVIPDDPVKQSNTRGMVTFATAGPNTRTTHVFINYGDNARLDVDGFAPFGRVVEGMNVVDQLYADYGDGPPEGKGPDQGRITAEGNAYLMREFPMLDYVNTAKVVE